jgi:lipoprotein-releasing system permease protein
MPFSGLILLAVRFLGGNPRAGGTRRGRSRLITAVLGVALSIVPLIVVQQIADGMISGIVSRFIEVGSYHLQVIPRGDAEPDAIRAVASGVSEIEGVTLALPERQGFGLIYSGTGRSGVTIRAVPAAFWENDPGVREYLEVTAGDFDLSDPESVVLGAHIASRLAVQPGDEVRVLTVRPLGEGRMLPRVSRFTVTGVVSSGYRDLDRLWVFVPYERGIRIIPDESARDLVGIKVEEPFALPNPLFNRGISAIPGAGSRNGSNGVEPGRSSRERSRDVVTALSGVVPADWFVANWYALEQGRYVSFLTSRNLLSVVMAMIVVVAAINVSSALVLLVVEKEQEIAILRATGVAARSIAGAFVLAGLLIGVAGSIIGAAVGLLLANNINELLRGIEWTASAIAGRSVTLLSSDFYLEEIPVTLRFLPVFASILFTLAVALAAGFLPARRATRILPERTLRHNG